LKEVAILTGLNLPAASSELAKLRVEMTDRVFANKPLFNVYSL
jgi:hypothetical protein